MANGTIAFDTLTTSDSVKTGTEKSIDTSYIFYGVAKALINATIDATLNNSFNISTNTDSGTGLYTYGMTNAFTTEIDLNCAIAGSCGGSPAFPRVGTNNTTSSAIEIHTEVSSSGANGDKPHYVEITGDLA